MRALSSVIEPVRLTAPESVRGPLPVLSREVEQTVIRDSGGDCESGSTVVFKHEGCRAGGQIVNGEQFMGQPVKAGPGVRRDAQGRGRDGEFRRGRDVAENDDGREVVVLVEGESRGGCGVCRDGRRKARCARLCW